MKWIKYLTVVPAIIDLVQLIKRRRQGVACPDDAQTAERAGRKVVQTGKDIRRDVKRGR